MFVRRPELKFGTDRDLECEMAVSEAFSDLVTGARDAGWTDDEVANAILGLAQSHIQRMREQAIICDDSSVVISADRRTAH